MKLIKHKHQEHSFLSHTPKLVSAFLSPLVKDENELIELLNPQLRISTQFNLKEALNRKVMVCGDYDADGILSTTLLVRYIENLGLEVGYYIPNRLSEGYGTRLETVVAAHKKGYDTIILLDNGVINTEVHSYCKEQGLTLIVIDHHQIPEPVVCDLLVHPDVMDEHFKGMCSAGLVHTLIGDKVDEYDTVLAAIATIGDVMDLRHQNRAIVKEGIKLLNTNHYPSIESLLNRPVDVWDASTVAFQIVPVFNALGRLADMGNVNTIVKYLLSTDPITIRSFSEQLKNINQQRKNLSQNQTHLALDVINDSDLFQIVHHPDFHPGIVGITAGQIASNTQKPALVLSGSQTLKGSVRASGFNVYGFLKQFEERYFLTFGGHQSACALSLLESDLVSFKREVQEAMVSVKIDELTYDVTVVEHDEITLSAYKELLKYEPFGQGFKPYPLYIEVIVIGVKALGQAGYLLNILPVGDLREVLYFKKDIKIEDENMHLGVIGSLQINNRGQLSMIAEALFVI